MNRLNIGIHGYPYVRALELVVRISKCVQALELDLNAIKEIFHSSVTSCDWKNTPGAYLRIFSSKAENIPIILAGFQKYGIYENVEVLPDMFFDKKEISSGAWERQYCFSCNDWLSPLSRKQR